MYYGPVAGQDMQSGGPASASDLRVRRIHLDLSGL